MSDKNHRCGDSCGKCLHMDFANIVFIVCQMLTLYLPTNERSSELSHPTPPGAMQNNASFRRLPCPPRGIFHERQLFP